MKKLNKLIRKAKQLDIKSARKEVCIHIVEHGYCYSCKGKCRYEDDNKSSDMGDGIVVIYGDLPDDTDGFEDAPIDTLVKMAKGVRANEEG